METRKFIILSNRYDNEAFSYEEYIDWCKDMECEPQDENSRAFWDWVYQEINDNWECDMDNIKCCKAYNLPVVIEGTLGLWFGRREIEPVEMDSVFSAIEKIVNDGNYEKYIEAEWEDGVINVSVSHHDGCHSFTIRAKEEEKKLPYLFDI